MASMLVLKMPTFYKAKESPQEWDAEYEALFNQTASFNTPQGYYNQEVMQARMLGPHLHQDKLRCYADLIHDTCEVQYETSLLAITFLTSNELTGNWMAASIDVRKSHVLTGIAAACAVAPGLNEVRMACSQELRVAKLSQDGQVLLNFLKNITAPEISRQPTEPKLFPSPEWDRLRRTHSNSSDEIEKLALNYLLLLRTKLIVLALQNIVYSFLGLKIPEVRLIKKSHQAKIAVPTEFEHAYKGAVRALHGAEEYKSGKAAARAAQKDLASRKVSRCTQCNKQAENRNTFRKCASCAKIDREVLYCSKVCQVASWKAGHKLVCGKPLDFDSAVQSATIPSQSSGDPLDLPGTPVGFNCPLPNQLVTQMHILRRRPFLDYSVRRNVFSNEQDVAGIRFPEPIRTHFLEHRKQAMTTGDPRSAALICDCLLWHMESQKSTGLSRDKIIEQISGEYSIPVANLRLALEEFDELRSLFPGRPP